MNSQNRWAWIPKNISPIGAVALIALIIFNKAEYKIPFLEWGLGALVTFTISVFFVAKKRMEKREFLYLLFPLLWVLFAILSTPFAHNISHHLSSLFVAGALTLISSFSILSVFTDERLAGKVISLIAFIWLLVNLLFLAGWLSGYYSYENGNFSGYIGNRNQLSIQTLILASLLVFFARNRSFVWLMLMVSGAIIMVTGSVKGFVLFFFILFYPLFLKVGTVKKFAVVFVGIVFIVSAYVAIPNVQERFGRFTMIFTDFDSLKKSESAFLRAWLIVEGGKVILNNPAFGVGVDNSRFVLIPPGRNFETSEEGLYSHNNYIEMALNAGIPGLLLFYFPLMYVYTKVNSRHRYYVAIKTWIAAYFLMGLAMVQYDNFISIFLYCLAIFMYFYYKRTADNDAFVIPDLHSQALRPD